MEIYQLTIAYRLDILPSLGIPPESLCLIPPSAIVWCSNLGNQNACAYNFAKLCLKNIDNNVCLNTVNLSKIIIVLYNYVIKYKYFLMYRRIINAIWRHETWSYTKENKPIVAKCTVLRVWNFILCCSWA